MNSSTRSWLIVLVAVLLILPANRALSQWAFMRLEDWQWERSRPRLAQDLRVLDPVLHAIEVYRMDHPIRHSHPAEAPGRCPETLQDLVPRYLKALPALPPTLRSMRYKQIVENWTMPLGTTVPIHRGCVIQIPLRPRSFWSGLLGTDPRGTLVYGGGMGRRTTHFSDLLFFEPTDRLAGWGYCPRRQTAPRGPQPEVDPRQKALRPYRETALKVLDPVPAALERYARDEHRYPARLTDLTPRYLLAVPQLPPTFGPLHYERVGDFHLLWVRLNQQVTDASGKPVDISGTFAYGPSGVAIGMLLDKSDPNSRPLYPDGGVGVWALYD